MVRILLKHLGQRLARAGARPAMAVAAILAGGLLATDAAQAQVTLTPQMEQKLTLDALTRPPAPPRPTRTSTHYSRHATSHRSARHVASQTHSGHHASTHTARNHHTATHRTASHRGSHSTTRTAHATHSSSHSTRTARR